MELVDKAKEALKNAYTPYADFKVGACLLTKTGKLYTGCNIQNKAHTPNCCAERVAFFKAISEGETEFEAIAVVNDKDTFCLPCGVCREVMSEFCNKDFKIYLSSKENIKEFTLEQLFPYAFELEK